MKVSILVVEDDYEMQHVVVETLEDEGYFAHGVSSVHDALSYVKTTPFDILVTDVRMAEIDGVTGFQMLKELVPNLRCIVITGYSTKEVTQQAIALQVDDYIVKPFALNTLTKSVRRVVHLNDLSNHYLDILKRIPKNLVSTALRFFIKEDKVKLDDLRKEIFQALYLGIRSTHLNIYSANRLFFDLATHDEEHKAYLLSPNPQAAESLLSKYGRLMDILKGLLRDEASQYAGQGSFPSTTFTPLYQAIQSGDITLEAFQLAPGLRRLTEGELLTSPEIRKLRESMWGPSSA